MPDKKISIETQLEPKVSPRFERVYQQAIKKTFGNIKEVDKFVKSVEMGAKGLEKLFKIDQKYVQHIRNQSLRTLKEQEQTYTRLGKEIQRIGNNLERVEKVERRIASGQMQTRFGVSLAELRERAPMLAAGYEARARGRIGAYQAGYGEQVMQGADALAQKAREDENEKNQERMRRASKLLVAGAAMQVAGQAVQGVGDLVFGTQLRQLGFQSQARGFAGDLYNQITSGNYAPLFAMMQRGGGGMMQKITGNAYWQSVLNQVGTGFGQAGQAVTGAGQAMVAAGVPVAGGMMGTQAAGNISSGAIGMAGTIRDATIGKTGADIAQQASQGLQFLQQLNPIEMRQFQELSSRRNQIQEFSVLSGNMGTAPFRALMQMSAAGGMTVDEMMPMFQRMRGAMGQNAAMGVAANAAAGLMNYGVSRGAAAEGITAFGTGLAGGSAAGLAQFESVMRRAMAAGISDSRLKEVLALSIADFTRTIGGRAGGVEGVSAAITNQASAIAARQGRGMEVADIQIAAQGMQAFNRAFSGGGNLSPLNVQVQGLKARMLRGLGPGAITAAAFLSPQDILTQTPIFKDIMRQRGIGEAAQNRMSQQFSQGISSMFQRLVPGATEAERAAIFAGSQGIDVETARAALGYAGGGLAPGVKAPALTGGMTLAPTKEAVTLNQAVIADAIAKMSPLMEALSNATMVDNMAKATLAATALAKGMEAMARVDPASLADIPDILERAAVALEHVGVAAAHITGEPPPTSSGPPISPAGTIPTMY